MKTMCFLANDWSKNSKSIISRIFYTTNKILHMQKPKELYCKQRNQWVNVYFIHVTVHASRLKGTVATDCFLTLHFDTGEVVKNKKNKGIDIGKKDKLDEIGEGYVLSVYLESTLKKYFDEQSKTGTFSFFVWTIESAVYSISPQKIEMHNALYSHQ